MPNPSLQVQAASLYASNDASYFSGTGGPFGFSPFTGQFGGVISSAGLASEPFNDVVYNVSAGDEVTFVVAVQNTGAGAAYGVTLQQAMPAGFVVPPAGLDLTVTDGTGTDLPTSGDLFGPGLLIGPAIGAYDSSSGLNVALVTYTLLAGGSLPGPNEDIRATTALTAYSASAGGANLVSGTPASAGTDVISAAPSPTVVAETDPTAVARGQLIAFDVAVALPAGTVSDLRVSPVLPGGTASLTLVSSAVLSTGTGLALGTPIVAADGSVQFGTVTAGPVGTVAAGTAGNDTLTLRLVVRAAGTTSGPATLQTVVSAADANAPGGLWSTTVSSSVGVVVPPAPPVLGGLTTGLTVRSDRAVVPFGTLTIGDAVAGDGTIAVTLGQGALGRLVTSGPGTLSAAGDSFTLTGPLATLQAAARQLVFVPSTQGVESFTVTVVDAAGGIAQDSSTTASVGPVSTDPLFDPGYYLAANPDVAAAGVDPYTHYLTYGWKEGRAPDPYFDSAFYLRTNPDVAAVGMNPLLHFETYGWKEGREPSLVFSDAAYSRANPDVVAAQLDPLVHFLQYGVEEGRTASLLGVPAGATADPLVDAATVQRQLSAQLLPNDAALAQLQASALFHAASGPGSWTQGTNPDAVFDTSYYLANNPDVRASGMDPLLHYETVGWQQGRDPSLAFSTSKYLAAYADVRNAGTDPVLDVLTTGQAAGRVALPTGGTEAADLLVDPAFLDRQLGATIVPAGLAGQQQASWAYDTSGWQAGLNPDAWFDTNYYLSHNPDVAAAHINPLLHYETYGWHEGRDPSAQFSTSKYLAANPDVKAAQLDPLLHYVQYGQGEGRATYAV